MLQATHDIYRRAKDFCGTFECLFSFCPHFVVVVIIVVVVVVVVAVFGIIIRNSKYHV
jgi:ABC-type multidrug transport system permease subunit